MEEIIIIVRSIDVNRKLNDIADKNKDSYILTLEVNPETALLINTLKNTINSGKRFIFNGADFKFRLTTENLVK